MSRAIVASWDFSVYGGSFGEDDATVLEVAAATAVAERLPLVTLVRSGGTRLQEGMAALVGIPRARLALRALARAGLAHLSVADAPTTGGVWISVSSGADLRVGVEGATVAFAGPRVVEAVTGTLPPPDSHTAESAYAAGLVDALLPGEDVPAWLGRVLTALTADPRPQPEPAPVEVPARTGWQQVQAARSRTTGGADLLGELLTDLVSLRAPTGDETVAAALGRLGGRPVVAVALAAQLGGRPTPNGYRLATRAYRLADRLQLPVLSLVDTPGADPGTTSEEGGIAPAMGEALDALLDCSSPTVAFVHGEGGSGGALAAAAADVVLLAADSYFAPIGPEGAAAALRRPAEECADLMRIGPADLLRLGFADAVAGPDALAAHLDRLSQMSAGDRLVRRSSRWGLALSGGF
jgi:acetyl-CoA carboxylase carboxyl transferase subunit beta